MTRLNLEPDEIHLHFAFTDEIKNAELLSDYAKLMNSKERQRHRRFIFEKDRHRFLVSRALIRTTLSRYKPIPPAQWRFTANPYGRPEILTAQNQDRLRFNISHAEGLIACAVVLDQDIGVDVESLDRAMDTTGIAQRFFAPQEVADLQRAHESERQKWFLFYWTLKESYIKARGMGLSLPLKQFTFQLLKNETSDISFDSAFNDDPKQWQFWLLAPTERHLAAVSVRRTSDRIYRLRMFKVIPELKSKAFFAPLLKQSRPNATWTN
jgi:4'-phosphopantetheinyl transferase